MVSSCHIFAESGGKAGRFCERGVKISDVEKILVLLHCIQQCFMSAVIYVTEDL